VAAQALAFEEDLVLFDTETARERFTTPAAGDRNTRSAAGYRGARLCSKCGFKKVLVGLNGGSIGVVAQWL